MRHVHASAIVDPGAVLGERVTVGPYAVIGPEVELGDDVEVGPHATILARTSIGARTRVFPHSVIGAEPQIVGSAGETTRLLIGQDNVIREFASIHAGSPRGVGCTRIGDDNYVMNHVHIAHDCQVGSHCILAGYSGMAGHVVVEDHVVFGGMTGVKQFVRIGESVFTAGKAKLSKDAPPFARVAGDRARFAGVNTIGLRRRGFAEDTIATLKHAFHVLFQSKLLLGPALRRAEEECGHSPEVQRLLRFIEKSERGFIR